jgi:hypothetical protein
MRRVILALGAVALGLAAGCGASATASHPSAPVATSAPATTPAATTGPLGTTFTVTYYGANANYTATYKIRLMKVTDPAKTDPSVTLDPGTSHVAALEFWMEGVAGTQGGGDPSNSTTATGTDGEAFSAAFSDPLDTNVYVSSTATLFPGEHGIWWTGVDLPAGVHVKSVRFLDVSIEMPPDTLPVTWTVPVPAAHVVQPASQPSQSQAPAASQPASQAPATQPAAPATPAGYLGNIFGGGTGNPCNFASGYQLGACNPTGETQSQYIANPGGPAPGTPTNNQGCYYVKMGEGYCPSTGKYIPMQDPNQPSPPPTTPSYTGDPSNGSGTGAACTTVQGYYQAGLPGHEDSSGFCVAD